jgi:hypothetical protein
MPVGEMGVDEMTVDEMACCQDYTFSFTWMKSKFK